MVVGGEISKPKPEWSTAMKEGSGGRGGGPGRLPGEGGPAWQEIKHQSINRCEPGDPTAAGLRRRQRDRPGAGARQGRGRRRKRVGYGRTVWRGPHARGCGGRMAENRVPRQAVAAADGWVLPVQAGAGARGLVLLFVVGPGRGRLAQSVGALVPARRRQRQGWRWLPRLLEEAQTGAQEAAAAAGAPGSANCAEYFRLWR